MTASTAARSSGRNPSAGVPAIVSSAAPAAGRQRLVELHDQVSRRSPLPLWTAVNPEMPCALMSDREQRGRGAVGTALVRHRIEADCAACRRSNDLIPAP